MLCSFLLLLLVPLSFCQQQQWNGGWWGQPQQSQLQRNANGEWIQGNWKWNANRQQWETMSDNQLQQVAPQAAVAPQPQPAQAAAAPQVPAISARDQRLQAVYGVPGKRNANQKLRVCCRSLKEADVDCRRRFCDFNALSSDTVISFMATCASRGPTVGQMWDCASSRVNHNECCKRQGVIDQCMPYCMTEEGVPQDYVKYLVCLTQFNKIRTCFQEHLEKNPNILGDD